MTRIRRSICTLCLVVVPGFSALLASGCGEPTAPATSPDQLDAAKKNAEVIIQKEYGSKAFDKGQKSEKVRKK
ncbi:hypothetical protein P12x_005005 [Tundrisphaera lichenicola]|uniref:hypothetical protein n=1 Tax=Tundrisphaera lichenicola TaxID=2029860 RepID=UPI003EBC00DA